VIAEALKCLFMILIVVSAAGMLVAEARR